MSRHQIIDTHVHFWNMRDPEPGLRWSWLERDVDHAVLGNIDAIKMLKYDIGSLWAEARFADVAGFVHVQDLGLGNDRSRLHRGLTSSLGVGFPRRVRAKPMSARIELAT